MNNAVINIKKIENLMSINNLSPMDLSEKIGVNQSTISRILNGVTTKPSNETLKSIAKYFNVNVKDITSSSTIESDIVDGDERIYLSTHELLMFLVESSKLSIRELSNFTGIEYQTLYDIIRGNTLNPNQITLDKLASFFNLTLSQIKVKEPLPFSYVKCSINPYEKYLPLLSLGDIKDWKTGLLKFNDVKKFTNTYNVNIGTKSFAYYVDDKKFNTDFKNGSTLIFNFQSDYEDNEYAVLLLNSDVSLYEIVQKKDDETFLRECGKMKVISCKNKSIEVFGVLIEIRFK